MIRGCSFPNRGDASVQNLIDGNPNTMWHTHGATKGRQAPPQWVSIDLGEIIEITGFTYLPRHDGTATGMVDRYSFYVSDDGDQWHAPVVQGTFNNIQNNPIQRTVSLDKPVRAKFIKFVAEHAVDGNDCISICEFGVLTK